MKYTILLMSSIVFLSCPKNDNELNMDLISLKNISNNDVVYQFYEKFGFTETCEHYRNLYYCRTKIDIAEWHKLPISNNHLMQINLLSNKVDTLKTASIISTRYKYANFFDDISLKKSEFITKASDIFIDTENGFYYYDKVSYKIYNPQASKMYEEVHTCN
jgi:hypothetical protein